MATSALISPPKKTSINHHPQACPFSSIMPPGTPYNSFVRPYPIRVDEFTVPRDGSLTVAALHLLSHTHSDHIIGLDAKSFASIVICSEDAKEMLLKHETYKARYLRQEEYLLERQRTFKHLQYTVQTNENGPLNIDLLVSNTQLVCI